MQLGPALVDVGEGEEGDVAARTLSQHLQLNVVHDFRVVVEQRAA